MPRGTLVGTSMGGLVALMLAATPAQPGAVDATLTPDRMAPRATPRARHAIES